VLGRDVRLNEYVWQTYDYHAGEETAESATAACDVIVEEEIPAGCAINHFQTLASILSHFLNTF
jgi:hypothetical protein